MSTTPDIENEITGIMRYFAYGHLKEGPMRETSARFHSLAVNLVSFLPTTTETLVTLRKLLESKDAAVRSALDIV